MVDKFMVVRWLLSNAAVLKEISALVAGWSEAISLSQRLEIVYKIAQVLLPVIESFPLFQAQALPVTEQEAEEEMRQVEAMAIPIPLLINVIAPIVVALIRSLMSREEDE